jgi:UDP-N-acetylmuramate dehydrogenase
MNIQESVSLGAHTTFRVGGPARFFVEVTSEDELARAVTFAKEKSLPVLVLGEGSNMLVSDEGFAGVVIRPRIMGIEFGVDGRVVAGAGEHWDDLVALCVSKNLGGIENLSWIPGSVGAAPVQNIGAYGTELADVLVWVEVFDINSGQTKKLSATDCRLGYRQSIFKESDGKSLVVLRVALQLSQGAEPNISYKDLTNYFAGKENPTIAEVRTAVIDIRTKKLPDITKVGTAGSFFKNPIISAAAYEALVAQYPGMPSFPVASADDQKKIPLAWILDHVCGLRGYTDGAVGLYETQPLAIVAYDSATSADVKRLVKKVSEMVKEKTGIDIEWEVNMIA